MTWCAQSFLLNGNSCRRGFKPLTLCDKQPHFWSNDFWVWCCRVAKRYLPILLSWNMFETSLFLIFLSACLQNFSYVRTDWAVMTSTLGAALLCSFRVGPLFGACIQIGLKAILESLQYSSTLGMLDSIYAQFNIVSYTCHPAPFYLNSDKPFLTPSDQSIL